MRYGDDETVFPNGKGSKSDFLDCLRERLSRRGRGFRIFAAEEGYRSGRRRRFWRGKAPLLDGCCKGDFLVGVLDLAQIRLDLTHSLTHVHHELKDGLRIKHTFKYIC